MPNKDLPIHQSIKNKIREIAQKNGETYNIVFTRLGLERFIARLQSSGYNDKLIFKGGLCLSNFIEIGRETKDIDFLAQHIKSSKEEFKKIFTEITQIDNNDGFVFDSVEILELSNEKKKYPGFRINIGYNFGSTKSKIQIDIGIGDIVEPREMYFKTLEASKRPLYLPSSLTISAYTPEYIFSEKLQASIMLAGENSRVKDYHDMYLLISSKILSIEELKISIRKTFENRKTELTLLPDFNFGEQTKLQKYWSAHHKVLIGEIKETLPENFKEVCQYINDYLLSNNII